MAVKRLSTLGFTWRHNWHLPNCWPSFHGVFGELVIRWQSCWVTRLASSFYLPNVDTCSPCSGNVFASIKRRWKEIPRGWPNVFFELSVYLYVLFSESLKQGCLPKGWLWVQLVPKRKYGDKLLYRNYRPISLASTSCKTLEHIFASHSQFIESNNVLVSFQRGLRKKVPATTEFIASGLDSNLSYDWDPLLINC